MPPWAGVITVWIGITAGNALKKPTMLWLWARDQRFASAAAAVEASYAAGMTDEFMEPVVLGDVAGEASGQNRRR